MSLYKRPNGVYYLDIFIGSKRVRKSTGTRDYKKAKTFHDKIANDRWEEKRLNKRKQRLWVEAVTRYIKESSHKRSLQSDIIHLRFIYNYWHNFRLNEINKDAIQDIIDKRFETGVSTATVNLMLQIIRCLLRKAYFDWDWLEAPPKIKLLPNQNKRVRWLTFGEAQRLLAELPFHLRDMAHFTLLTGLRASNVRLLKWEQIDLAAKHGYINSFESKTNKAIPVPLNEDAINILKKQPRINKFIFNYDGHPVGQLNTKAFRKALKRANIKDFRWHDLRHTWASWHVQNGTNLQELQQLGGWSSLEMVLRYAHLSSRHLQEAANRLHVTKLSQQHLRIIKK